MRIEKLIAPSMLILCLLVLAPLCAFAELPEGLPETTYYEKMTYLEDTEHHKAGTEMVSIRWIRVTPAQLKALLEARGAEAMLPTAETLPEGISIVEGALTIRYLQGMNSLPEGFIPPEDEPNEASEKDGMLIELWNIPITVLTESFTSAAMRLEGQDGTPYTFQINLNTPQMRNLSAKADLKNDLVLVLESRGRNPSVQGIHRDLHLPKEGEHFLDVLPVYQVYPSRRDAPDVSIDTLKAILEAARPID